ncbi:MAG: deoxyribose-phosphate aldolase, partial [Halonotius sp.]
MDRADLAPLIDHTVLGPTTTQTAVDRVVDDAIEAGMNVCIPPCYIGSVTDDAPDSLTIATVIGFPHGQAAPATKREAAKTAVAAGADELDVVCNVGRLTAEEQAAVVDELAAITTAVAVPVKVIIETALLTDEEKHRACEAAVDADADMVKTSTGFADTDPAGATVADVELMAEYLPVKASGGIGDYETAMAMIEAG